MRYTVTRDCCTSGNCFRCSVHGDLPTPLGKPARVIHLETDDRDVAERAAREWRGYDARIEHAVGA